MNSTEDTAIDLEMLERLNGAHDRVQAFGRSGRKVVRPEADPRTHVIRLLETEMRDHGWTRVLVRARRSDGAYTYGRAYGKVFMDLKLDVKCYQDDYGWSWVTAKTSDGRLLCVQWPSGLASKAGDGS